ncbi:MAG: helix-turn-helix domain-containing protein [Planctomycetota bacterium]|nr:helix-turn-helix domain-containing protein [Planctomycetota bacterium]
MRKHPSDIPLLAGHFCETMSRRMGCGPIRFDSAGLKALEAYLWPGNVRELKNVISRAILRAKSEQPDSETIALKLEHLGEEFRTSSGAVGSHSSPGVSGAPDARLAPEGQPAGTLRESVDAFQTQCVEHALKTNGWVWSHAAQSLGMHRANFHRLATRLGFKRPPAGPG